MLMLLSVAFIMHTMATLKLDLLASSMIPWKQPMNARSIRCEKKVESEMSDVLHTIYTSERLDLW